MYPQNQQITGAASVRPEPQIETQTNRNVELQKELHHNIDLLRQRLESVSRASDQPPPAESPCEILVPLASELRKIGDSTQFAIERIMEITRLLELPSLSDHSQPSRAMEKLARLG